MGKVFDKVMTILGVKDEEEVIEEVVTEEEYSEPVPFRNRSSWKKNREDSISSSKRSNLISLDGGQKSSAKMLIVEPTRFDEVRTYVEHLKQKRSIILRLNKLDREEAQRVVDFMSGATHALDGNMRKLGEEIFCFAPPSVVIEGDVEQDLYDLGIRS